MVLDPSAFSFSTLHYFVVLDQHERVIDLFTYTFVDSGYCVSQGGGGGVRVVKFIKTRIWPLQNIGDLFFRAKCHGSDAVLCTLSTYGNSLVTAAVARIVAPAFPRPSLDTSDSSLHYGAPILSFTVVH